MELTSCKEIPDLIIPICPYLIDAERIKILDSEYQRQVLNAIACHLISLHHVAKIENKSHKIPIKLASRKIQNILKPEGMYLYQILELCLMLHPYIKTSHKNAHYLFLNLNSEVLKAKIKSILNPFVFDKKPKNGDKKRVITSIYCKQLKNLKEYINPFGANFQTPIFSDLIDCAMIQSQKNDEFKRKHYVPFLSANRDLINALLSSDWSVVSSQHGENTIQGVGGNKTFF